MPVPDWFINFSSILMPVPVPDWLTNFSSILMPVTDWLINFLSILTPAPDWSIQILLDNGCNQILKDEDEQAPIHVAAMAGRTK